VTGCVVIKPVFISVVVC